MNMTLWIVQGLLALAFIAAGAVKLFAYEKYRARQAQAVSILHADLHSPAAREISPAPRT